MYQVLVITILLSMLPSCKNDVTSEHHRVIEFAVFNLFRNHGFQPAYLGDEHYISFCKNIGFLNDTIESHDDRMQIPLTKDDIKNLMEILPIRDLKFIAFNEVEKLFDNRSKYKSVLIISNFYKDKHGYYYIQVSLIFGRCGVFSRSMKIKHDHGIFFEIEHDER